MLQITDVKYKGNSTTCATNWFRKSDHLLNVDQVSTDCCINTLVRGMSDLL